MTDIPMTTITVFYSECWGSATDNFPTNLLEFQKWLHKIIEDIPSSFRASATIEISSERGYEGSHNGTLTIEYSRPETPEETAEREGKWRNRRADEIAHYERVLVDLKRRQ